jgi:hypothetical protein
MRGDGTEKKRAEQLLTVLLSVFPSPRVSCLSFRDNSAGKAVHFIPLHPTLSSIALPLLVHRAHAVSSALADRINLARGGAFPEIELSPQQLVNCVTANSTNGCRGG